MDDLTQEVAQDLSRLTLDGDVEQEARLMLAAPSLETIIQRLHEMEVCRTVYRMLLVASQRGVFLVVMKLITL